MTTESKMRIYNTCIRTVLRYAAETRVETFKKNSIEMKMLRAIREINWRDRVIKEQIRRDI